MSSDLPPTDAIASLRRRPRGRQAPDFKTGADESLATIFAQRAHRTDKSCCLCSSPTRLGDMRPAQRIPNRDPGLRASLGAKASFGAEIGL